MTFRFSDCRNLPVDAVMALYAHAAWAKDRTADQTREILERSSLVASLWEDDRMIAFARVMTDFIFRAAIYDLIVHPDRRIRGAGKQLVEALLGHPRLARVPVFHLLTRDKRLFYEKLGFVVAAQAGLDALVLTRNTLPSVPQINRSC